MNELIKELAIKADPEFEKQFVPEDLVFLEKFAKLIVEECINVTRAVEKKAHDQNTYMGDDAPAFDHRWSIKKHFGIK